MIFLVALGPRQPRGPRHRVLLSLILPSGTIGKKPIEGAPPPGTPLPKKRTIQHEGAASSSSKTLTGETLRKDSTEVPKNPLDDFAVPPAGTPYGESSFNPSGSFSWVIGLGPMLDEIWSDESFKGFSEEPLQVDNREGMRMLSRVRFFMFSSKTSKSRILDFNLRNCCRLFSQILSTPERRRPYLPRVKKPYSTSVRRTKS